jgi:hypothetical protein
MPISEYEPPMARKHNIKQIHIIRKCLLSVSYYCSDLCMYTARSPILLV